MLSSKLYTCLDVIFYFFLFWQQGFFLCTPPMQIKVIQYFLIICACTLAATVARVTFRPCDDFFRFLDISLGLLWGLPLSWNCFGQPVLGLLAVILNVFHLWMIFCAVEWLISNCSEVFLNPFPDLYAVSGLVQEDYVRIGIIQSTAVA